MLHIVIVLFARESASPRNVPVKGACYKLQESRLPNFSGNLIKLISCENMKLTSLVLPTIEGYQ